MYLKTIKVLIGCTERHEIPPRRNWAKTGAWSIDSDPLYWRVKWVMPSFNCPTLFFNFLRKVPGLWIILVLLDWIGLEDQATYMSDGNQIKLNLVRHTKPQR